MKASTHKHNFKKEKELLSETKEDINNFDALYKYFYNDVYRYTYTLVNSKEDTEDITAVVFEQFYRKVNDITWQGVTLKSWLFKTARNQCYKLLEQNINTLQ